MTSEVDESCASCGMAGGRSFLRNLRQAFLFSATTILGTTSAFSSSADRPEYSVCIRIVDNLYDLSGDTGIDQRELEAGFLGRLEFWKYIFATRISYLIEHQNSGAKSLVRPGVIDNVLSVYVSANKTSGECKRTGCVATIYYNDGTTIFYEEGVEIDGASLIRAYMPNDPPELTISGIGLSLSGLLKTVFVRGKVESISFNQSEVFIPCPAPSRYLAKCEDFLGNLPQAEWPVHKSFQTVTMSKYRTASLRTEQAVKNDDDCK